MYRGLVESNEITRRSEIARSRLASCDLCPHRCRVDRLAGETGICGIGTTAKVGGCGPHWGEESVLVGNHGSGAVFFAGCNLRCVFCQNEELSHPEQFPGQATSVTDRQLADLLLDLQARGCHNVNLVTPSHVVPQILAALALAAADGLQVPVVYNSSGYDSLETLQLLDGIVAIYMPDCKFIRRETASRYTNAPDYPEVMQRALAEMHRQVGDLEVDARGVALRGMLVRHLVMPGLSEEGGEIMRFLAAALGRDTYVNIMDQYRPCFHAGLYPEINRQLAAGELAAVREAARAAGLHRLDERDLGRMLRRLFGQ